ncbi:MAG TPA: HAMP domain-containing sensor histidine kinase, partial [Clostridia bacterium]
MRHLFDKIRKCHYESHKKHDEYHKQYEEYKKKQIEFYIKKQEFINSIKNSRQELKSTERFSKEANSIYEDIWSNRIRLQWYMYEARKNRAQLHRLHNHVKYFPLMILAVNILIWYIVFRYAGIKFISISIAILISLGGLSQFLSLKTIEKRVLNPVGRLKNAVEEIAKGNYNVKVERDCSSEINILIDSFNEMAEKLLESEKIKAEYEENRKDLIANISHDLKTPITSIQGYVEAITDQNGVPPEKLNKYLKIIHNNSTYMNKLVDDLFLFSKLDMQKLEFHFVNIEVRPFINDLMEEIKFEMEDRGVEFSFTDNMKDDCSFNIDMKRINQVLRNIIWNAVKYGPEEDLRLSVILERVENMVCILIKDNGPGIPEDKLPHIFDRFYRVDTERTKNFMSTGLGLAIAKELVDAHGGHIAVE